jgi:hypothetical protein
VRWQNAGGLLLAFVARGGRARITFSAGGVVPDASGNQHRRFQEAHDY